MSDPINISVHYTVSLGPVPDVASSAINCHSSFVLQEAYARDKILQDELQELAEQRSLYSVYTDLIAFWDHVLKMSKRLRFQTSPRTSLTQRFVCFRKVQATTRAAAAATASSSGRRSAARSSPAGHV